MENLSYDEKNMTLYDDKARVIFSLHKNRLILRRYIDTSDVLKKIIAKEYCELTNKDIKEVTDFLNFKDEFFCS